MRATEKGKIERFIGEREIRRKGGSGLLEVGQRFGQTTVFSFMRPILVPV